MVFDFSSGSKGAAPGGVTVRYVDQVVTDGAGEPIPLDGEAFLEVVAYGTQPPLDADLQGDVNHQANWKALREVEFGSYFEGIYVLGIGVNEELPFRVELKPDNTGFYVDIAHPSS